MLNDAEYQFGMIEIGEKEPRTCVNDNADLITVFWPIHRGNDYFSYMKCAKCGQYYKVLEPIPDNLMGELPTNIKGVKND